MNVSIANAASISSMDISELIQSSYIQYVITLVDIALSSLLFYTTILAIPQEMVYMWLSPKPFSIPNLLYAITRYPSVLDQVFDSWVDFLPLGSLCNKLSYTEEVGGMLGYAGVQGLLVARAYALCEGNKTVTIFLALFFWGGLASNLYILITAGGCQGFISLPASLIGNICTIVTDLVVFGICLWKVWGTWKLKREAGIQRDNDLVSLILKQTISRLCFVIIFTPILIIVDEVRNSLGIAIVGNIQRSLSTIFLADFMLDLRQQNSTAIHAADIKLLTIQIRSVANYIHQSILVEMRDHDTSVHRRAEENDGLSTESPGVGIGSGIEASA